MKTTLLLCCLAVATLAQNGWTETARSFERVSLVAIPVTIGLGVASMPCSALVPVSEWAARLVAVQTGAGFVIQEIGLLPEPTGDAWIDRHTPLHIVGSAGVVGGLYALGRVCKMSKPSALGLACAGALAAGVGVECWQQWSGRGRISGKDMTVDALSVALTAAVLVWKGR